jgi:hypothetical protein
MIKAKQIDQKSNSNNNSSRNGSLVFGHLNNKIKKDSCSRVYIYLFNRTEDVYAIMQCGRHLELLFTDLRLKNRKIFQKRTPCKSMVPSLF